MTKTSPLSMYKDTQHCIYLSVTLYMAFPVILFIILADITSIRRLDVFLINEALVLYQVAISE